MTGRAAQYYSVHESDTPLEEFKESYREMKNSKFTATEIRKNSVNNIVGVVVRVNVWGGTAL